MYSFTSDIVFYFVIAQLLHIHSDGHNFPSEITMLIIE